jgi:DnaJ-class molecular chaperone
MQIMNDYYKILQVSKTSTQDEIKKSYRKLAKKFHPDVNKDNAKAAEIFKKISEAYATLSDENKKASYDSKMFGSSQSSNKEYTKNTNSTSHENRQRPNMTEAHFSSASKSFESFFGFDPNSDSPELKKNNDKIKPMKTKDAFEAIFGKRRF